MVTETAFHPPALSHRALYFGYLIAAAQTVLACSVGNAPDPERAYRQLYQHDSYWYGNIAERGYHSTVPPPSPNATARGNVAFFPGYPLLVAVPVWLGVPTRYAALAVAQLAAGAFWTYVLLFLERWRVPAGGAAAALAVLAAHPAAFFLVAAYSESLFLAALLGFLYWSPTGPAPSFGLAAAHGVVLTATRIVGLPLVCLPLLMAVFPAARSVRWRSAATLAVLAASGGLAFLLFCQLQFDRWDFYMWTQRNGWGIVPDYLAVFEARWYPLALPDWPDGGGSPNRLSLLAVPFTLGLFGLLLGLEVWAALAHRDGGWRERLGFYAAGGVLFYVPVSGLVTVGMRSMIRYSLCTHVLLLLAFAHLLSRRPLGPWARGLGSALVPLWVLASWWQQVVFLKIFLRGGWVA